jgi:hypothetical protein
VTRVLVVALLFSVFFTVTTQGAPTVAVAKTPSLVCPQTELGDAGLQARYATMWERYSADVDEATKKVRGEIEKQTKSATVSGNLDLALFWKALGKEFEQKSELRWDEPTLKKGWNERFGDALFPAEFSVAVKKASEAYASARKNLEKGYGELVAEFTKAEKLEEAVKVRGEIKGLLAEKAPASEPAPAPKPEPKPGPQKTTTFLSSLNATAKRLQNGWFEIGSVWGEPIIQGEQRGDHSIFLHARPDSFSSVTYQLAPGTESFESGVVVPKVKGEQGNPATPLIFEAWGDGRLLWRSQPVAAMNQMQNCRVGVKGVTTLDLRVVCPGRDNWAVSVWFEPRVVGVR